MVWFSRRAVNYLKVHAQFLIWLIMERKPMVVMLSGQYSSFNLILLNNYSKLFWNKMFFFVVVVTFNNIEILNL